MNLGIIFLTGLTTGGLTCLAVQGGLLAGVIANQKSREQSRGQKTPMNSDWLPIGLFLLSKLIVYTLAGAVLGLIGSFFIMSTTFRVSFQLLSALYMMALALNLLEVHPIFRYVIIRPPRSLERRIARTTKTDNWFTPMLLGLFTIFIPCGVTQAMQILAMNSGSAIQGAAIMFVFTVGTMPLFAGIGFLTTKLSGLWQKRFLFASAFALILMSLYTLNGVLVVLDSPISVQHLLAKAQVIQSASPTQNNQTIVKPGEVQLVNLNVSNSGYSPDFIQVEQGIPVKMMLDSRDSYSCTNAFIFKEFGIKTMLEPNDSQTFAFTPNKKGRFTFTCSMGMYTGTMEVI